ncbi:MAG TPA: dTDP-4-amino-4,6-dideoxygalactose transaminase [Phycisphaeraceae bacterium]
MAKLPQTPPLPAELLREVASSHPDAVGDADAAPTQAWPASPYRIPFNRPCLTGGEYRHVAAAIASGKISGDGAFARRCEALLERELGVRKALLTTSCTHALEMCALLLNLKPGDEVIVPSFTFVSTANAFVLHGARPVFADIRPDTLNLDERRLEALVTPRTRAVVVVHYAGVGCEMGAILDIARRRDLVVIEDNAHGLFGRYRGKPLGSLGQMATLSFHETKNFTCGEGGALLLNDEALVDRAEILREKGTDRSRFFRGQVDKYTWQDVGSSYVMSDLLAAFLHAQLEARQRIQASRQRLWQRYRDELSEWAQRQGVQLPAQPQHCQHPAHAFYLVMPEAAQQQGLIDHLKRRGILAVFHYLPLHLSPMGQRFGGRPGDCPVTERISARLVRLPLFNGMRRAEQDEVIAAVRSFRGG